MVRKTVFIDSEIDPVKEKILDLGGINARGQILHNTDKTKWIEFLRDTEFVCGHNIFLHDLLYIGSTLSQAGIQEHQIIDTLPLSPLLFPRKPYHSLCKDDKLNGEDRNNPVNDCKKAQTLLADECRAFAKLSSPLQQIYYALLGKQQAFRAFFDYISFQNQGIPLVPYIERVFAGQICAHLDLDALSTQYPIELALSLALIHADDFESITPPWVLKNYPGLEEVMIRLRATPCTQGCSYCNAKLDAVEGLKRYFGFPSYRLFDGKNLQQQSVEKALAGDSLLAVFPTGGGKSITFQIPALMMGEAVKGLTVVISPLQSLMKDQVDNLKKKGITQVATINGLLNPVERLQVIESVGQGKVHLLYLSPESLRSNTIERLLLKRKVVRFVIDEAHCFSAWGQDFRVDYLYIGDFIKALQEKKNLARGIPVSCFTATAKLKVREDIQAYFAEKLGLNLALFVAYSARKNLHYIVKERVSEQEKDKELRSLLEGKNGPSIIYVARTKTAEKLAKKLNDEGYEARAYHGKMDKSQKTENQEAFIQGLTEIMVATSAFGMGVDKSDVRMVIHYDISDSLENYVQEAGRAGRDPKEQADCYILYDEQDLDRHFALLNQTKLGIKEIQQIWKAIRQLTKYRNQVSSSALEIARQAGWGDDIRDLESRVKTAIAALETAGYLKRGKNMPQIYADSILAANVQEAIDQITASQLFTETQEEHATRIIKKLIAAKHRRNSLDDAAESRVDYIADHLGLDRKEVIEAVNLMREAKVLADAKDLMAIIQNDRKSAMQRLKSFTLLESLILGEFPSSDGSSFVLNLKSLHEQLREKAKFTTQDKPDISLKKIKTLLNFWATKGWLKKSPFLDKHTLININSWEPIHFTTARLDLRHTIAEKILGYLYEWYKQGGKERNKKSVSFSVVGIHERWQREWGFLAQEKALSVSDIEDSLFFLSQIGAIHIDGGFMVSYNRLSINRLQTNNRYQYNKEDYKKLEEFYSQRTQQIHIVGEYAQLMIKNHKKALEFVDDYFHKNYYSFVNKYFPGIRKKDIKRAITPNQFRKLFGALSPNQLEIINDSSYQYIVVAAGPGSGKTRLLVHKLASLLWLEEVRHEQLLMLTFSRAAATEFKLRLKALIGTAATYLEIKTFHSYCFDLLGRMGNLVEAKQVIAQVNKKIREGEIEQNQITKTVLVIDEAQDMDAHEFELVRNLMRQNEAMRVIAVGDDDQNIYAFRGSDSQFLSKFLESEKSHKYELLENYRSRPNLVAFSNAFIMQLSQRMKQQDIMAKQTEGGTLRLTKYEGGSLIGPLVEAIISVSLAGTSAVLTRTNEEALLLYHLLRKAEIPVELSQEHNDFPLFSLIEVRRFWADITAQRDDTATIAQEDWDLAVNQLKQSFAQSSQLPLVLRLIEVFDKMHPKVKHSSEFRSFTSESKSHDFSTESQERIWVSTMHKSKGKEFENVFLLLKNFELSQDDSKRLLYVAMTRAKSNLFIHTDGDDLDSLVQQHGKIFHKTGLAPIPDALMLQFAYKALILDHFFETQQNFKGLYSGAALIPYANSELLTLDNQRLIRFSKAGREKINELCAKGYTLVDAEIRAIVCWRKQGQDQEIKVALPTLYFKKTKELLGRNR